MRKRDIGNWRRQLLIELRRDKKRAAVLAALFVIAAVLAVRLVLKQSTPLRTRAAAKAVVAPIRAEASSGALARLGSGGGSADWLTELRTEQPEITRDIFAPNPAYFPPEVRSTQAQVELAPGEATTQPAQPPKPDPREQELAILAQARALQLQSTSISQTPTAIINGLVLRKGDWINDFEVVEIAARTCVVAKKGVKVTLRMKR
jgi:hypothetical protein